MLRNLTDGKDNWRAMDLCNKLLLTCSLLIAHSLALHIFNNSTTIHNAMETTGHKTTKNKTVTTQQENNMSYMSYNNVKINASNNSSTIPSRHNSTNSTVFGSSHHNSTVSSPIVITTHQTNVSATKTSFAAQSASDSTRAAPRTPVSAAYATSTPAYLTTGTVLGNKTNKETASGGLNHSETSLTVLFSVVLGVIVLIILGLFFYKMTKSKWAQYSHQPLHNEDTGGQFLVTDDTLEISGGLYDGPQIYNSTVTALNEDQIYTAAQFRLEFLHEGRATYNHH